MENKNVLVTGGAGFIGSNLTMRLLERGCRVTVFDDLSRPGGGARRNIRDMLIRHGDNPLLEFICGDVSVYDRLRPCMDGADVIIHVAAQTAMTTSIDDPMGDFNTNAVGTFNVLEAARRAKQDGGDPIVVYTSTNKVYGDLTHKPVNLCESETRWDFASPDYFEGINESYPVCYEGPYGCSKGTGDAYCLDYSRTYGLRTVEFRMSGIYGTGQHATEDQGWVTWLLRRCIESEPITIYGDGKQVRDILFIDDLLDAVETAVDDIDVTNGKAYNIGGGRANSFSILELLGLFKEHFMIEPGRVLYAPWRRADQRVYISDTGRAYREMGWAPEIPAQEGIRRVYDWLGGFCI